MKTLQATGWPAWLRSAWPHLQKLQVNGRDQSWYSLPSFPLETVYDLILVDGPPSSSTDPLARLPALHQLHQLIGERTVPILDDANREWETEVARRWQQDFPELKFKKLSTGRGLLVVAKYPDIFDLLP
jgi:hypothetical protein